MASTGSRSRAGFPFHLRVLTGVGVGVLLGLVVGTRPLAFGLGLETVGAQALLVIRALKALATPLIFLAVLDAIVQTSIPRTKGLVLVGISLANAIVAVAIGLGLAHWLGAGQGHFAELRYAARTPATSAPAETAAPHWTGLSGLVPENVIDPFRNNHVIGVVLIALLAGLGLRSVLGRGSPAQQAGARALASLVHAALEICVRILGWFVEIVPFAVAFVIASMVGKSGASALLGLGAFLGTILLGLVLHAGVYYGFVLRLVGGMPLARFYRGGRDAVVTALSCGSSVATLPVTLACLERLRVSSSSARLAACVGTNLNHDGIILYEASATIFVSQALGLHASLGDQLGIAGAAVLAGIGVAGVPEAGLITLPLVLGAGGIPAAVAALAVPLVLPVDWILGRFRAATNVLSDMTVAVLLDRFFEARREPR